MSRALGYLAELIRGLRDVPGLLRRVSVLERQLGDQQALLEELFLGSPRERTKAKP